MQICSYKTDKPQTFNPSVREAIMEADEAAVLAGFDLAAYNRYYAISKLGEEWIVILILSGIERQFFGYAPITKD